MNKDMVDTVVSAIKLWASNNEKIRRIYIAGSQAQTCLAEGQSKRSDIDVILFLSPGADESDIYKNLSALGLHHGILIHPLIIRSEDNAFKTAIPEYREMIRAAVMIYDLNTNAQQKN